MLLVEVLKHNYGDKSSAGIASTHCAALVSLARAAELAVPARQSASVHHPCKQNLNYGLGGEDIDTVNGDGAFDACMGRNPHEPPDVRTEWHAWVTAEERKRTLYAVFVLSSLLVSAYNHAPALTNSEIKLELPCDEDLWAADSAEAWRFLCETPVAEQRPISFASALSSLLTASQREAQHHWTSQSFDQAFGSGVKLETIPDSDISPSTFGCLILINALHNYVWETRQRHVGRQWTTQETEAMHAHIEPALRAWQAAWASNPHHSLDRPNPSGAGSLAADCIPLLDLAYVRLFVTRSKEAFFRRDFEGVVDEPEIIQHPDYSSSSSYSRSHSSKSYGETEDSPAMDDSYIKVEHSDLACADAYPQQSDAASAHTTKRARHLRKAAFFAANSLAMADKLGVTFADYDSRELPMSSAMCAFDCAQVLAEWMSMIQQRVGRYLGILGKDDIDLGQVPAIMLLEDDDSKLLEKIRDILSSAEVELAINSNPASGVTCMTGASYGSRILLVTARMLQRAAVWPGT